MKLLPMRAALPIAIVSLGLVSAALAHGNEDDSTMDMTGGVVGNYDPARPTISTATNSTGSSPPTYFRYHEHSGLMLAHIVLMSVGWIFVLPVGVMLSIAQSRFTLPIQFTFLVINVFGVLLATVYNANTPDLYPNNAHHKFGWLLIWTVCAQIILSLCNAYMTRNGSSDDLGERVAFIPISTEVLEEHQRIQDLQEYRYSNDSGQGTEPNTESLRSHSQSSLSGDRSSQNSSTRRGFELVDSSNEKPGLTAMNKLNRFLSQKLPVLMSSRVQLILSTVYQSINRVILLLGWVALITGAVTYGGLFKGNRVFSGLAHFIKGGVFFWYGILTLGRWAGCFANLGWAWNIRPLRNITGGNAFTPSAEFVESFLIFFYGSTNIFLEHLAAWGGEWSAQDLEHISITVMFFGGGLCGMLIESRRIREMLNATIAETRKHNPYGSDEASWQPPKTYGFSMNPLPALIVLLLGMMMSSHHQASMVSSMVHKQWGNLLVGSALARTVTYVLFYLSPPASILPSRPPSELITAFCLMAGGLIFMASSVDTVMSMEMNNLNAMFVFTVTMGLVTFLMAWIIVVIAIKGWALKREGAYAFSALNAA